MSDIVYENIENNSTKCSCLTENMETDTNILIHSDTKINQLNQESSVDFVKMSISITEEINQNIFKDIESSKSVSENVESVLPEVTSAELTNITIQPESSNQCIIQNTNVIQDPQSLVINTDFNISNETANSSNSYNCLDTPKLVCYAENIYKKIRNNYLRGCVWSPDGTCLLSCSNDNKLRIFELPRASHSSNYYNEVAEITEISPVLHMQESDLIYDYAWYPFMNSANPDTCFFASSSRGNSVVLWDAYNGLERARIQAYNHMDEAAIAYSIAFSMDGYKMLCGFDKFHQIFDITRLSSKPTRVPTLGTKSELRGIVSCMASSPLLPGVYACGSYSGDAALYDLSSRPSEGPVLEFLRAESRTGGVTQLRFSPTDAHQLITGARIDPELHVWDLRSAGSPLYAISLRNVRTNQRIQFDYHPSGQYVLSGNHDGCVSVHSLTETQESRNGECYLRTVNRWAVTANDVVNGVSVHPSRPLLATTSGQRRIQPVWRRPGMLRSEVHTSSGIDQDSSSDEWSSSDDCGDGQTSNTEENMLKIWAYPSVNANKSI